MTASASTPAVPITITNAASSGGSRLHHTTGVERSADATIAYTAPLAGTIAGARLQPALAEAAAPSRARMLPSRSPVQSAVTSR